MSTERSWDELVELNESQEYGTAWLPDRDDDQPRTLVGTVRGYDEGPVSEFTGECPWICIVEDRARKVWSVWLNRAVLMSEFEKQRPMPNDRIVLRYRGQQETASRPGAAPAHLYALTVDRDPLLPGFLIHPELGAGERRLELESDVPADSEAGAVEQQQPHSAVITDAHVVDDRPEGGDDHDSIPF